MRMPPFLQSTIFIRPDTIWRSENANLCHQCLGPGAYPKKLWPPRRMFWANPRIAFQAQLGGDGICLPDRGDGSPVRSLASLGADQRGL